MTDVDDRMSYFTDRCQKLNGRALVMPCSLPIGHDGLCVPQEWPKQSASCDDQRIVQETLAAIDGDAYLLEIENLNGRDCYKAIQTNVRILRSALVRLGEQRKQMLDDLEKCLEVIGTGNLFGRELERNINRYKEK